MTNGHACILVVGWSTWCECDGGCQVHFALSIRFESLYAFECADGSETGADILSDAILEEQIARQAKVFLRR